MWLVQIYTRDLGWRSCAHRTVSGLVAAHIKKTKSLGWHFSIIRGLWSTNTEARFILHTNCERETNFLTSQSDNNTYLIVCVLYSTLHFTFPYLTMSTKAPYVHYERKECLSWGILLMVQIWKGIKKRKMKSHGSRVYQTITVCVFLTNPLLRWCLIQINSCPGGLTLHLSHITKMWKSPKNVSQNGLFENTFRKSFSTV